MAARRGEGLTIATLAEAVEAVVNGGAHWGTNLSGDHKVRLRIGRETWPLGQVATSFINGEFVLVLDAAGEPLT